jgi:O-acetyl-ADP-ribose deacetylase (regulator of RNase III)
VAAERAARRFRSLTWYLSFVLLRFVDSDARVADALRKAFAPHAEVGVAHGDLLAAAEHAVVSPANSYGFMDGGIDRAFDAFFGPRLERDVRDAIQRRPEGFLPVGASLIVPTTHPRIRYVVVAPTMLMPEHVEAQNAYRAMRAVLRLARAEPIKGQPLYGSGLTTGVGGVSPAAAAEAMREAYADWLRT